jgi:hypothetical protein
LSESRGGICGIRMVITNRVFIQIIFFLTFFFYVNFFFFLNIGTDVQPYLYLAILLYLFSTRQGFRVVNKYELILVVVLLYSILRVDVFLMNDLDYRAIILYIKYNINIFFSFILLYFYSRHIHLINIKNYFLIIKVYFFVSIVQMLSYYIPALVKFNSFISLFIYRENNLENMNVGRGVSSLTPEPSFLAMIFIMFFLLNFYFYFVSELITKKEYIGYSLLALIGVLLTKSGSGYLLLAILYILYFILRKSVGKISVVILLTLILFMFVELPNNRGLHILKGMMGGLDFLFSDQSVAHRVTHLFLGISALFENILGYGAATMQIYALDFMNYGLFQYVNEEQYVQYLRGGYIPLSLLGGLLFFYGAMGLFIVYFLISIFLVTPFVRREGELLKFGILSFVFCMFLILSSNPLLYPVIWILLGSSLNYLFYNNEKLKKYGKII